MCQPHTLALVLLLNGEKWTGMHQYGEIHSSKGLITSSHRDTIYVFIYFITTYMNKFL